MIRARWRTGCWTVPDRCGVRTQLRPLWTFSRAELLPGWYDDWVLFKAEGWRQLGLHALEALADRLVTECRYGEAAIAALAATKVDPLRESARAALIRVQLADHNRSQALREFDRYRRLLRSEFDLDPTPRLYALLEEAAPVTLR